MTLEALFLGLGIADLRRYVDLREPESLYLDFKCVADPRMEREDRKNFAKALSGFANSDGGMVIWGVEARKVGDIDAAIALCEIPSLTLFHQQLVSLTPQLASPAVPGVAHRRLDVTADTGFAVTFVPASDSGPHMAKGGEDRYYRRSGDQFLRMEHFEVADLFGRRPHPVLSIGYRVASHGGNQTHQKYTIILALKNTGRGAAHAPLLALKQGAWRLGQHGIDGNGSLGLPRLARGRGSEYISFGASADCIIHPGMEHEVVSIDGEFERGATEVAPVLISYRIASQELTLFEGELEVRGAQILAVAP